MRHELIHFLTHVDNEKVMAAVIRNLNAEAFETLLHHLEWTQPATQERWLKQCDLLLRY